MKIGLYNLEPNYINIALEKIKLYHQEKGDSVENYFALNHQNYDKIYTSSIFTFTNKIYVTADMIIGGTGFNLETKLSDEIEAMKPKINIGFTCYDDKTEILTKRGWILFKDLSYTDNIATLNQNTFNLEYHKPTKIIIKNYNGEMICFKNKYIDLKVTPNHNMFVNLKQTRRQQFQLIDAEKVSTYFNIEFKKDAEWKGNEQRYFYFDTNYKITNRDNNRSKILMDDWLEFMGYYLSEGNCQYKPKTHSYIVKISQKINTEKYKTMQKCIEKIQYKYYTNLKCGDFYISNKQLFCYLKKFGLCHDKYVPEYIKGLSSRQIEIFINAYVLGDGVRYKNKNFNDTIGIITSSIKMADDIQELFLKIGICADIGIHCKKGQGSFSKKNNRYIIATNDIYRIFGNRHCSTPMLSKVNKKSIMRENYNNKIYCCEVPNGIIYVRRNGKAVWCGNSRGCIRKCEFCVVRKKEGNIRAVGDIYDIWDGKSKELILLDNNIFALPKHFELICSQVKKENIMVDFNQGLDIRLLDERKCELLKSIKIKEYRFSFDNNNLADIVKEKCKLLKKYRIRGLWYVLVNYQSTFEEDLEKVNILRGLGQQIYTMTYNNIKTDKRYIALNFWTNSPLFRHTMDFNIFLNDTKRGKEYKKYFNMDKK